MSIEQTQVIDMITLDKEHDRVTLIISDDLAWGENDHLLKLQAKLNNYLTFIKSGELLRKHPAARGKHVHLDLVCKFAPDDTGREFLGLCAEVIADAGIAFHYRTLTIQ